MSYDAQHTRALAMVQKRGARVTFTKAIPGVYNPVTDTQSDAGTATVTGAAVQVAGDPRVYQQLTLIESAAPTLFVAPDTIGMLPSLGATMMWGGVSYTVRNITPLAPDGVAIAAHIVVAQ